MTRRQKLQKQASRSLEGGALPIYKYAEKYGVHPVTVWRALRDGRLEYVQIGKRKLVLPPIVQRETPEHHFADKSV
jgi:hypothetical protein